MLTKETIMQIATSEANAGDFPKVVQGFKAAGVTKYDYIVATGMYVFYDAEGAKVEAQLNGIPKEVAAESSVDAITDAIKQAQAGKVDFEKFCALAGQAGVPYWHADLVSMLVTYRDRDDTVLKVEPIPSE
ncbi:DUF1398 family protein [Listeria booriae]|uniref:DUF1398 domain-containing protein n=1 Tax=Listeria booriae TaxID=1552123 RepID=UPI00164D1455|nr:DUF1398 family protein [Listeria booriae]MBC6166114.1 DUF1398 family protein [Listeria booriae]